MLPHHFSGGKWPRSADGQGRRQRACAFPVNQKFALWCWTNSQKTGEKAKPEHSFLKAPFVLQPLHRHLSGWYTARTSAQSDCSVACTWRVPVCRFLWKRQITGSQGSSGWDILVTQLQCSSSPRGLRINKFQCGPGRLSFPEGP